MNIRKLIGRLYHDSAMGVTLQDALFDMNYIALNCGSAVVGGLGSGLKEEQITAVGAGQLVATGVPQDFMNLGRIGWISTPNDAEWAKFEFDDGAATASGVTLADGTLIEADGVYCIKYFTETACEQVTIPGDYVPGEISLLLRGDLYRASKSDSNASSAVVGHIEILVPRFQLDGNFELTLNNGGAANVPLSGQALLTYDGAASCESSGYYAVVKKIMIDADWTSNLITIACDSAEPVAIASGESKKVSIYGIFSNGTSKLLDSSLLTFVIDEGTAAGTTVSVDGTITAGSTAGDAALTVTVNDKPAVKAVIAVAVTA